MNIIESINIRKSYQNDSKESNLVLKGINLAIKKGEFISLMGPSGAGKSTLLHLLATLDNSDEGTIKYFIKSDIIEINKLNSIELSKFRNNNIGIIFQFHHLLQELNVLENVSLPALIQGENNRTSETKAKVILNRVGLEDKYSSKVNELSGGEQQRVSIARALINNPAIIFADEPTGSLDEINSDNIINLLLELKSEYNTTLIVATHSDKLAKYSDRVINLRSGELVN